MIKKFNIIDTDSVLLVTAAERGANVRVKTVNAYKDICKHKHIHDNNHRHNNNSKTTKQST